MGTAAQSSLPRALPDEPSLRRFTVDEYHRMIRAGILREGEPYELLEGRVVRKMTRDPPHDATLMRLDRALRRRLPDDWLVRVQSAVVTNDSEPEPDLAVVRGPIERYFRNHPDPDDVALIVEISDTTLREDRGRKRRLYARARLGVYWVVNLPARRIEVHTDPSGPARAPRYGQVQSVTPGQLLPLFVPGRTFDPIPVSEIFPT